MYKLLLILLLSFSFTQDICEGTCFSEEEVQNMYNNIKALEFKRETCESAYLNFESQLEECDEQAKLYEEQIKIKDEMIKTIKPKWYENKYLWFFGGVIFTSGSVFLAGQL